MNKLNSLIAVVVCVLVFAACGDKPPKGILPPAEMTKVLADLHIAEASLSVKKLMGLDALTYYQEQYGIILKTHKLTRKQWEESFAYYSKHLKLLNAIYDKVLEELHNREQEARSPKKT